MNRQKSTKPEQMREKFELFVMEMGDAVSALKKYVAGLGRSELLPLDYSLESLDRLEEAYALTLDHTVASEVDDDTFATRVSRYMGETLRHIVGGKWGLCEDKQAFEYGLPGINKLPGLPADYIWCPLLVVDNFREGRRTGLLKQATEAVLELVEKP